MKGNQSNENYAKLVSFALVDTDNISISECAAAARRLGLFSFEFV